MASGVSVCCHSTRNVLTTSDCIAGSRTKRARTLATFAAIAGIASVSSTTSVVGRPLTGAGHCRSRPRVRGGWWLAGGCAADAGVGGDAGSICPNAVVIVCRIAASCWATASSCSNVAGLNHPPLDGHLHPLRERDGVCPQLVFQGGNPALQHARNRWMYPRHTPRSAKVFTQLLHSSVA